MTLLLPSSENITCGNVWRRNTRHKIGTCNCDVLVFPKRYFLTFDELGFCFLFPVRHFQGPLTFLCLAVEVAPRESLKLHGQGFQLNLPGPPFSISSLLCFSLRCCPVRVLTSLCLMFGVFFSVAVIHFWCFFFRHACPFPASFFANS